MKIRVWNWTSWSKPPGRFPAFTGARLSGGGFGGSIVALIEKEKAAAVSEGLAAAFPVQGRPPDQTPGRYSLGRSKDGEAMTLAGNRKLWRNPRRLSSYGNRRRFGSRPAGDRPGSPCRKGRRFERSRSLRGRSGPGKGLGGDAGRVGDHGDLLQRISTDEADRRNRWPTL
ncbi:MAG: hypothetical protein MZV70_69140 [Desulfobacterales bacterium]|nr:hypothetical protein [Desulfobacterales bacterium]